MPDKEKQFVDFGGAPLAELIGLMKKVMEKHSYQDANDNEWRYVGRV
jgi:hypothetical protein